MYKSNVHDSHQRNASTFTWGKCKTNCEWRGIAPTNWMSQWNASYWTQHANPKYSWRKKYESTHAGVKWAACRLFVPEVTKLHAIKWNCNDTLSFPLFAIRYLQRLDSKCRIIATAIKSQYLTIFSVQPSCCNRNVQCMFVTMVKSYS